MIRTEIQSIIQKRTLGLMFVLGAASMAFAQDQQKLNVTGSVQDTSNNGVGYASVTFTNKQNAKLSDATLANVDGNFNVELAPGNYEVTIEAIDYKLKTQTISITKPGAIPALIIEGIEAANLDNTTQIEGVVITAQTKAYRVELDKRVYDVSSDIVSKGGNLQDVLQNVPSVTVDTDGSVSMRGNTNVRFLINGKPSSLLGIDDGANALQTIPAEQIERIEVISNPSSKYEASGTAGILNIILKKDKKMGFNGNVTGTLGYLPRTNLNANLNWRKGDWTWYINGGGGYNENESSSKNRTLQKAEMDQIDALRLPFTKYSNQIGKTERNGQNYNVNAGAVYDITPNTSINFSGMLRSFDNDQNTLNTYDELEYRTTMALQDPNDPNSPLIEVGPRTEEQLFRSRNSIGNNKNFATQVDFGLDQKLDDNGQNLSVSGSFQTNKSDGTTLITQNTLNLTRDLSELDLVNNVSNESKSKTFIGKADYELPIGEESKFEAGARFDYNRNTYDYFVDQSEGGSAFSPRYDFTSNTIYSEKILGIYTQFKSKIGEKLSYQVGLRSETSTIDINFNNYNEQGQAVHQPEVKKNYTKFFPSVFLSYNVGEKDQILLNYSRRINRPRAFSMIPFMSFDDDRNFFRGNPDLNPTYENSFELGYSISNRKVTINPTIYYKKSEDEQNRYQYLDTTGAINTIPFNVGSETNYGLDLNGTYDPFSWWKMMVSADLYGYNNTGSYNMFPGNKETEMDFSGEGFSYRLRFNNTFKIDKTFSFQIQSFYRAGEKTVMNNRKAMYGIDFGASKTIMNGNGTISLNVRDLFNTRRMRNATETNQYYRDMEMQWQPRQASISFSYRFKQGEKVEIKKPKKDINNNYDGGDEQGGPM